MSKAKGNREGCVAGSLLVAVLPSRLQDGSAERRGEAARGYAAATARAERVNER
jgi:hypothetical protein